MLGVVKYDRTHETAIHDRRPKRPLKQRQIRYTESLAKAVDPRQLPDSNACIPGLKPVREFAPSDDGDPSEADAFNRMIRELRNQSPAPNRVE